MSSIRRHLPRLSREFYRGFAAVHWTFCLEDRTAGWLDEPFHLRFREVMMHACCRHGCINPAYCLMPDHWHCLLVGIREEADLYLAARFLRTHLEAKLSVGILQKQAHDHVLRSEEQDQAMLPGVCHYILENPVRAGLSREANDYTFSGAIIPGYPDLPIHDKGYWELYWRIYHRLVKERL